MTLDVDPSHAASSFWPKVSRRFGCAGRAFVSADIPAGFCGSRRHVEVTYTVDRAGSLVVIVKAIGQNGVYYNEHSIPVNVEVWLGSPPPPPRRLASPHRLGRGRLVSLQVPFYEEDVLYLCDPKDDSMMMA